jgi:L,D-peptidoglycan transpeptidase YkuD (ErfK/YbiS/YcfS/YnhG family)
MIKKRLANIHVRQSPLCRSQGLMQAGSLRLRVAIGRSGMTHAKREGDGASPIGRFALHGLWLRGGTRLVAACGLPARKTRKDDLWCDATGHRLYNRPARAPLAASHEEMHRADGLYDRVIEIGWNMRPRIMGRGSAIFLHLARGALEPTAGCVAVQRRDIPTLLPLIGRRTRLILSR